MRGGASRRELNEFGIPDRITRVDSSPSRLWAASALRTVSFLAILLNSLDLLATALGIHGFGNREGNPLLAGLAQHYWLAFVLLKGALIPLMIWRLYRYRDHSRTGDLASWGLALVAIALTVAVGQWVGWIAGVLQVRGTLLF